MTDSPEHRTTIEHEVIRRWVEDRGGHPAAVADHASEEAGMLRIQFPDAEVEADHPVGDEDDLPVERLDWSVFFERFEEQELALVYLDPEDSATDSADPPAEDSADSTPSRWYEFADRMAVGKF